jgi:hypothetical protein
MPAILYFGQLQVKYSSASTKLAEVENVKLFVIQNVVDKL